MARPQDRSVFEVYANEYDLITNAAQREKPHRKEVSALVTRLEPKTALDAGCASGLTTQLLGEMGVKTTGLDRSKPILKYARKKYQGRKLPIAFRHGEFESLPRTMSGKYDLVACLANSISGVPSVTRLRKSLKGFRRVLAPGGHLVLQMLNYAAIKEGVLLPIKATMNGDIVYERFSERRGNVLSIYVTRSDFGQQPAHLEVFRHDFGNFEPSVILREIKSVGFGRVEKYSNLLLTSKYVRSARDLVVIAARD